MHRSPLPPTRRAVLGGMLALAAAPLAAAAPEPQVAPDIARILERRRLVVAVLDAAAPPFLDRAADGALIGTDIALAHDMAAALGVALALDPRAGGIDTVIARVMSRDVDLGLAGISIDLDRAQRVRFSRPYAVVQQALLVNRARFAQDPGRDPITALNRPDAVIALRGDRADAAVRQQLPQAMFRRFSHWEPDMVEAVLRGEVAAALGDEVEIGRALSATADAPLRLRAITISALRQSIGVALPWDSVQLAAWVDLYLEQAGAPLALNELMRVFGRGRPQ
jgi:polar amino acid transport system substrate-binding protein